MKITEIQIKNFGKLHNINVRPLPGLNVIYGENETGKSTMQQFITGMLFGMEKQEKTGKNDSYQQYEPWNSSSFYAGAMKFTVGGKPFFLERNFYHKEKSSSLVNEMDGEKLSVEQGDLEMLLGGMKKGIVNLEKHIENIQKYGVPVVVTLNSFVTDTEAENEFIRQFCEEKGCEFALSEVWEKGGEGGIALAEKVLEKQAEKAAKKEEKKKLKEAKKAEKAAAKEEKKKQKEAYRYARKNIKGEMYSEVSDLLGGLTGNIAGKGHDEAYWKRDGTKVEKEAFAHFFAASLNGDSNRKEIMKEYFPAAFQRYEEMVRDEL